MWVCFILFLSCLFCCLFRGFFKIELKIELKQSRNQSQNLQKSPLTFHFLFQQCEKHAEGKDTKGVKVPLVASRSIIQIKKCQQQAILREFEMHLEATKTMFQLNFPLKNVYCNLSISQLHPQISCDFFHLEARKSLNRWLQHWRICLYLLSDDNRLMQKKRN